MSNSISYLMIAIGFVFLFLLVTAVHSVEGKSAIEISASLYKDGYTTITAKGNIPYLYFNDVLVAKNIIDFYEFNYTIPEDKLPYEVNWAVYTQEKSQYSSPIKTGTIRVVKITESSEKPELAKPTPKYIASQKLFATWFKTNFSVYIQTQTDFQKELIVDALNVWQWYTKGTITFKQVDNFGDADIAIIVVRDLQSEYQCIFYESLGCTDPLINLQAQEIKHVDMHIGASFYEQIYDENTGVTHKSLKKLPDMMFFYTALHEIGHALGLAHFEENKNDIMYPFIEGQNMSVSKANLKTLEYAYAE